MTHILRHIALVLALIFVGISANAIVQDYDVKQLPYFADLADGHITEYLYDASGRKLQTKYLVDNRSVFAASVAGEIENDELIATADSSMIETELIRDYVGNYVYEDSVLERIITPNGYITSVGTYKYYILDHQGNITTTVPINMRSPWIDYYPFGSSMARMEGSERYKFSGKEFDTKNGIYLYDFHARQYSPIHGRFTSLDPLCEIDYAISPYAFCRNNPVRYTDPTGNIVLFINGFCVNPSESGNSNYWLGTDRYIMNLFNDYNALYFDGACGSYNIFSLNPDYRKFVGEINGKTYAKTIFSDITDKNGNINESIKIISHSMGGAYAKGFISSLVEYMTLNDIPLSTIEFEADFAPFQPKSQDAIFSIKTFQFSHSDDFIAGDDAINGAIYNSSNYGDAKAAHSISSFYIEFNQLLNQILYK